MSGATSVSLLTIAFAILLGVQNTRNVHAFTTRSYDLDVPGSKPIRIIEADPGWDLNTRKPPTLHRNDRVRSDRVTQGLDDIKNNYKPFTHRGDKDDRFKHRPDFEHRTLKPDVISNRNDRFPTGLDEEDNSEKLKKFLNSYAQNVKKVNVQVDNSNVQENDDQLHLSDKYVDIPSEEHAVDENRGKPEKSKSWNLLHFDKIQQRPQDNKGWVSMDAVPWSVSKISKWHGKPKKDKYQNQQQNNHGYYDQSNRPYNDRFQVGSQEEFPRPNYPKPIRPNGVIGHRPNGYYDDPLEEGDIEDPVDDDYYNNRRPSFPRPSATYGHKVNLHTVQSYGHSGNGNKRPFKDNCNNNQHNHHNPGHSSFGNVPDDGIITDGLPANFPEHDYGNRRRGVGGDSSASGTISTSATHPFKGEGEWVLLSTTKGYKYPKNPRQRSLRFSDSVSDGGDNSLQTMNTHKSVRLTVLPPLDDGRINMTTSHGGLLQVDGTFESVEEAQKQHAKRQRLKLRPQRRPVKVRPQLGELEPYRTKKTQALRQPVSSQYQIQNGDNIVSESVQSSSVSDSSAVLAAVGAGMIPAGMALLVPMAMSGKRKRRQVEIPEYLTTSPYTNSVELTLPSTL